MATYQETTHANVHRGVYATAERATHLYEQARIDVGRFIGAAKPASEIVFTKNCTEAFNLLAHELIVDIHIPKNVDGDSLAKFEQTQ